MRQTSRSKAVRHARSGGQEPHTICHSWPTPLSICFERSSLSLAISPRCRRRRCGHLRNSRRRVIRAKQLMCPVRQIGSAGIFARDKAITPGALQTSPTVRTACKTLRQRGRLRQSRHRGICKLLKREDPRGFESHPLRHLPSLTAPSASVRMVFLFGATLLCTSRPVPNPTLSATASCATGELIGSKITRVPDASISPQISLQNPQNARCFGHARSNPTQVASRGCLMMRESASRHSLRVRNPYPRKNAMPQRLNHDGSDETTTASVVPPSSFSDPVDRHCATRQDLIP